MYLACTDVYMCAELHSSTVWIYRRTSDYIHHYAYVLSIYVNVQTCIHPQYRYYRIVITFACRHIFFNIRASAYTRLYFKSRYRFLGAHLSDLYRLLIMYLHGGVYQDLDAVAIQV